MKRDWFYWWLRLIVEVVYCALWLLVQVETVKLTVNFHWESAVKSIWMGWALLFIAAIQFKAFEAVGTLERRLKGDQWTH